MKNVCPAPEAPRQTDGRRCQAAQSPRGAAAGDAATDGRSGAARTASWSSSPTCLGQIAQGSVIVDGEARRLALTGESDRFAAFGVGPVRRKQSRASPPDWNSILTALPPPPKRSEERRVGKECRSRWSP